jgi:hypothetical protein
MNIPIIKLENHTSKIMSGGHFQEMIQLLNSSVEQKHIWNTDFVEMKSFLSRYLEVTVKHYSEYYTDNHSNTGADGGYTSGWYSDVYVPVGEPALHTIVGNVKKLKKLRNENLIDYIFTLESWIDVSLKMKELKSYIEKGRKPNANAKEKYVAPMSSKKDLDKVESILKELTSKMRDDLISIWTDDYINNFNDIIKMAKNKKLKDSYNAIRNEFERYKHPYKDVVDSASQNYNVFDMDRMGNGQVASVSFVRGYKKVITQMATEQAEFAIETFIHKNKEKLTSIVGKKGNLKDIGIDVDSNRGVVEGYLNFTFLDGSGFMVKNKIVVKSNRDKQFMQYPTTFHNIVLVDGTKKKMFSEKEMNELFV